MKGLTKNHILNSFNELLSQYSFEKITMEMIAKKSGVSKPTIYRYFMDKNDIMNHNYVQFIQEMIDESNCNSWLDMFIKMYTHATEVSQRLRNSYRTQGQNDYRTFVYELSMCIIEEKVRKCRNGEGLAREERFRLSIFCYGGIQVMREWLDCADLSPEEAGEMLYRSMPETLRDLW